MFKVIPGNHNFIISLNGQIRTKSGNLTDLVFDGNLVSIELYGKVEKLDIYWLALIAHYEVDLPKQYKNIKFVDCNPVLTRTNCGKFMFMNRLPIINRRYRLIPNYPNYGVDENGIVLDIKLNRVLEVDDKKLAYPSVNIYDPDRGFFKNVFIHRLVALAWCYNDDYVSKPIVNHKDGNKQNFRYFNLEWCSYQENSQHAIDNDLRKPKEYKVKDITTGIIQNYSSFRDFCLSVGLSEKNRFNSNPLKTKPQLINDRYEVKEKSDNTPWMSEDEYKLKRNKYTITLLFPDNKKEVYTTIVEVMFRLKIWNISYNIEEIIKVAKIKHPDVKIEVVENFSTVAIQALKVETGEVIEAESIRKISLLTDVAFSTIQKAVNENDEYIHKGYVFRFKSESPWPSIFLKNPNAPKKIQAKNLRTGEVINFPSVKITEKALNTSGFVIRNRISNKTPLGEWELEEV